MMPLTVQTICAAVGGTVLQSSGAAVRDVTTDSRRVPQEALFIPLVGERFDGHAYIEKALEAGAAGCLTAKTPEALLPGKFYIQVPDTRLALKALAAWYRGQFRLPVVQVTGSVGKTTTKEMIAAVLTQKYETLRTEGNLNNDIGAPLTLLRLMPEHEAAVIETGMNHFGEIRYLGEMVRPDIAAITNVGDAHIENLGNTRQGILQAKCEIFENLTPEGVAVLNGDDELLNTVTLPQIILRCGEGEHCDVRVTDIDDRGLEKVGVLKQVLHAVGVLGKLEEVGLFLGVLDLTAAVGALAVDKLALRPEALAGLAVLALVGALVDVAVVVHLLEDLLNGRNMIVVRRADEAVVRNIHELPQVENALFAADDVVDKLLRGHARVARFVLDLLTVLVCSGQEHDVVARQALVARHRVGRHGAVGVADVELIGRVIDGGGDIESLLVHWCFPLFCPRRMKAGRN